MSKTLSFRGLLADGLQEKIKLATLNGRTGYQITKFQIISTQPGQQSVELLGKIYSKFQTSLDDLVDFSDGDLLAMAYFTNGSGISAYRTSPGYQSTIFDNKVVNQDIFVCANDAGGNTVAMNYYIELETMPLTDVQSTQLTLKNLRTIASR